MKANLLRAEFVKSGVTQQEVAKSVGMSESTFIRKMKTGKFTLDDANKMIELLNIENPGDIFFSRN